MKYGLLQILKLALDVVRTKLLFSKARIIRFPTDIRGKKYIEVGEGFTTGVGCRLEAYPKDEGPKVLIFGKNIQINDYVHITAMRSVIIGDNVLIASKVYISDCSHGIYEGSEFDSNPTSIPKDRPYVIDDVFIGDNVWLGENVSILPGVSIGSGTIVGANSVVTKDLPENVIAVGIPAKPIKIFNNDSQKWEKIQ